LFLGFKLKSVPLHSSISGSDDLSIKLKNFERNLGVLK